MKHLFAILCLSRLAAFGFDSEGWLERRAAYDGEVARMKELYGKCVKALKTPAEDLVVPIENYPDGRVKVSLKARRAQYFIDEGVVWGEDVEVRQYEPDGTQSSEVFAQNCVVDRNTKSGYVAGHAKGRYDKTEIEGDEIYFSFSEEFVKILSKVAIITKDVDIKGTEL